MENTAPPIVIRVSMPTQGQQKAFRVNPADPVWALKKQVIDKMASEVKESLNYGLYLPPSAGGKQGKFMEEKRDVASYKLETNSTIEFIMKIRVLPASLTENGDISPQLNSKKRQKVFLEYVMKANGEKVSERGLKGMDPNFWSESQETPLSVAVMNNDKEMITMLIENGAILDYRVGDKDFWKTPLHIAATHNKVVALQTLIDFGAWVHSTDCQGFTALHYAVCGGFTECVQELLHAKADTETFDENGKGPLHQSCLHNFDAITSLLIDYSANMNAVNIAGNTPLHVACTRNSKECAKILLIRGANTEKVNKSAQNPIQAAILSGSNEIAEMIKNFKDEDIVPPPPSMFSEDVPPILSVVNKHHSQNISSSLSRLHSRASSEPPKQMGSLGSHSSLLGVKARAGGPAGLRSSFLSESNNALDGSGSEINLFQALAKSNSMISVHAAGQTQNKTIKRVSLLLSPSKLAIPPPPSTLKPKEIVKLMVIPLPPPPPPPPSIATPISISTLCISLPPPPPPPTNFGTQRVNSENSTKDETENTSDYGKLEKEKSISNQTINSQSSKLNAPKIIAKLKETITNGSNNIEQVMPNILSGFDSLEILLRTAVERFIKAEIELKKVKSEKMDLESEFLNYKIVNKADRMNISS